MRKKSQYLSSDDKAVRLALLPKIEAVLDSDKYDDSQAMAKIVSLIKEDFHAKVCSFYVRRAGDILELYATDGLNPHAIKHTLLRIGEGVVGKIATLNEIYYTKNIREDKDFVLRPETDEENLKATMGSPIAPGGRMVGVLIVQYEDKRDFAESELYQLKLLSLVIGDIRRHSRKILNPQETTPIDGIGIAPLRLTGIGISGGLCMGAAVLHKRDLGDFEIFATDSKQEKKRLEDAILKLHEFYDDIIAKLPQNSQQSEIMETIKLMSADKGFISSMFKFIENGITAEGSVQKTLDDLREKMASVEDSYIAQRIDDIEDIASRLLFILVSKNSSASLQLPDQAVLVGRNISAADVLSLDLSKLKGIISEEGNFSSHVGIIARALEIPFVARVPKVFSRIAPKDLIAMDGDHAIAYIRPGEEFRQRYRESYDLYSEELNQMRQDANLPAITLDGFNISLMMNAALLMDLPHLKNYGADGIGLYRTEMPFLNRETLPDYETQSKLYKAIYAAVPEKPVIIRTLDIGSDKALPHMHRGHEDNPAMGWRAIRVSLDSVGLFKTQLRALCDAGQGHDLNIMFPMVASASEFRRAKDILLNVAMEYPKIKQLKIGTMLEIPSLVFSLPELAREIDFISVGTNDLSQFFFAMDRDNKKVNERYSVLNTSFMRLMTMVSNICQAHKIPVSICGESAADPINLIAYLGLGFKSFSMSARSLGYARRAIRSLNHHQVQSLICDLMKREIEDIRNPIQNFALDNGIHLKR